jgi:2-dehydro-3-deoxyphosphogluconate aldolase/(4S)-4-hydroxy-2-oxoglutarate aldolase
LTKAGNAATLRTVRAETLGRLRGHRAIAVIRTDAIAGGVAMAQAAAAGGLRALEVTWTCHQPAALVAALRRALPDCWIGAGTLRSPMAVQEAIAAGAQFCFMPHTDPAAIAVAVAAQIPAIPGALSPTEVITAWAAGAAAVKIFPADAVGGPAYIKALAPVLPDIPLVPTGGITPTNAGDFWAAGAAAVGLASCIFPSSAIAAGDWATVGSLAKRLAETAKPWQIAPTAKEMG